ncbi:MAG: GTP-binding protein [Deltaproteobacteria bacterium]|nr:GTP-binding protein [Deltaproteobacteria bacterium]
MSMLRFSTAGSVDDGKSTLIGRLLFDAKGIFEDQLAHVEEASRRRGFDRTDLALLTDGLRAEREQGITIDVAYRYFATPKRKFIIADTPGHIQYTRNMVTGASTADVALVLVDARHGVVEQSRRHATLSILLGIPQMILCVNKMDLVDWSPARFDEIKREFAQLIAKLNGPTPYAIPLSALHGDNVVTHSDKTPWYQGPALLELLESDALVPAIDTTHPRFAVQWVIRPQSEAFHDYRGYGGQIAGGSFSVGDEVIVLPAGHVSRITAIDLGTQSLAHARAPQSVTLRLADDLDISRGDMISLANSQPMVTNHLRARVCWMATKPLTARSTLAIKHTTRWARAMVTQIESKLDVTTLEAIPNVTKLELNDIATLALKTTSPLVIDPYAINRRTGSFILVDESTNSTVAAGMIEAAIDD